MVGFNGKLEREIENGSTSDYCCISIVIHVPLIPTQWFAHDLKEFTNCIQDSLDLVCIPFAIEGAMPRQI